MSIIAELLTWLRQGSVPEDSIVALYRQEIEEVFG